MPGIASLQAGQYYAHPRNRFWPLMAELLKHPLPDDYTERLQLLTNNGIALWDVLSECTREGSLDASISTASQEANPIPDWLQAHPQVDRILTNGGHADKTLRRTFPEIAERYRCHALPSTSPANARWSLQALGTVWRPALLNPPD